MAERQAASRDDERFALDRTYFREQARDALWTFFHPWSFAARERETESRHAESR